MPDKDGNTLRASYELASRKLGREVRKEIPLPFCAEHLWEWYLQLQDSEASDYSNILAWATLTGNQPTSDEIALLQRMMAARSKWWAAKREKENKVVN